MPKIRDKIRYATDFIERIIAEAPRRQATSDDERRATHLVQRELDRLGLSTTVHPFRFNDSLYANLALHMGLGTLGTIVSGVAPPIGLLLHVLAAGSYTLDSTRRAYVLRRLLGFKKSQNLVATLPAAGEVELRIVVVSHIDAAFTGFIFRPEVVRRMSKDLPRPLGFLHRSVALAVNTQWALAGMDLLRILFGPLTWPLRPLEYLLTLPAAIAFLVNLEIVLRNQIVPGANDNLSAVAALPILAARLGASQPASVELNFVVSGCEEASLGGADALAREMQTEWEKDRTVVIVPDSLSGGDLQLYSPEGEVIRFPPPRWLVDTALSVARSDDRFREVEEFAVPVGGSDAAAFLCHGYDALGLGCVDRTIGAPRHYHQVSDTPENLEPEKIIYCIDFMERLVRAVYATRLGIPRSRAKSGRKRAANPASVRAKKTKAVKTRAKKKNTRKTAATKKAAKKTTEKKKAASKRAARKPGTPEKAGAAKRGAGAKKATRPKAARRPAAKRPPPARP